ncbi:MAG TPA: hypothetical protein VJ742_13325 [Nitrososphaera sp.]|nr:hypothetical protein [Nitrososphaera sp.]
MLAEKKDFMSIVDRLRIVEQKGKYGYKVLYVEAAPEIRSMCIEPVPADIRYPDGYCGDANWKRQLVQLPLPWTLYRITVSEELGGKRVYPNITHISSLRGPIRRDTKMLYFLPLPNVYGNWESISYCALETPPVPQESDLMNAAWGIENFWASSFRYIMVPGQWRDGYDVSSDKVAERLKILRWLGMPSVKAARYSDLPGLYKKWEELSLAKAQQLPWGKAPLGSFKEFVEATENI